MQGLRLGGSPLTPYSLNLVFKAGKWNEDVHGGHLLNFYFLLKTRLQFDKICIKFLISDQTNLNLLLE